MWVQGIDGALQQRHHVIIVDEAQPEDDHQPKGKAHGRSSQRQLAQLFDDRRPCHALPLDDALLACSRSLVASSSALGAQSVHAVERCRSLLTGIMDLRRECKPAAHLEEQEEDVRRAIICQTFALHHCAQLAAGTNLHQPLATVAASTLFSRLTCSQHSGGILIDKSMLDNCTGRSRWASNWQQLTSLSRATTATGSVAASMEPNSRLCGQLQP